MWGSVVRHCRDGMRISAAYCSGDAFYRLAAYFQAFPWVLKVASRTCTSSCTQSIQRTTGMHDDSEPRAVVCHVLQTCPCML